MLSHVMLQIIKIGVLYVMRVKIELYYQILVNVNVILGCMIQVLKNVKFAIILGCIFNI